MSSTTRGLNKAFGLKDPRHYGRFFGLSLLMTGLLGLLLVLSVLLIMLGPVVQSMTVEALGKGPWSLFDILFSVGRYGLVLFFLLTAHAGIYWLCPAVKRKFRLFTPGAIFSVLSWVGVSYGFQLYLRYFNNYDKIYGSLGAVILMLVWFYLMSLLLLVGGAIDSVTHPEYRARTLADGAPEPQPFPLKLALFALLLTIGIPIGLKIAFRDREMAPIAHEIAGPLRTAIEAGRAGGEGRFDHAALEAVLRESTEEDGTLVLSRLRERVSAIQSYLDATAAEDVSTLREDELLAFFLNVHNAGVLIILAQSTTDATLYSQVMADRYDKQFLRLAEQDISPLELKHNVLRSFWTNDPLLHFGLIGDQNGAARAQARIGRTVFRGDGVRAQLIEAARAGLAAPHTVLRDGRFVLPRFLQTYRSDFVVDTEDGIAGLVSLLLRIVSTEARVLLEAEGDDALDYQNHDWELDG